MVALLAAFLFLLSQEAFASDICTTSETKRGATPNQPCIFPFEVNGKTYTECTTDFNPDKTLWCKTGDPERPGQIKWGYCGGKCDKCETNSVYSRGATPNKPCIFPFKHNGQFHNECIDVDDKKLTNICATEINSRSGAIKDYGYCNCNCPSKSRSVCTTPCQTIEDVPCQFPFKFKHPLDGERIYYNCTTDFDEGQGAWCSTKTNSNGYHIPGEYGLCKEECLREETTDKKESIKLEARFESGTYLYDEDDDCGKSLAEVDYYDTGVKIVGGTDAKISEMPFMANLGYNEKSRVLYLCGGTLINRRYVISAAHCHTTEKPIRHVMLGQTNLTTDVECDGCAPAQKFEITDDLLTIHKDWTPGDFKSGADILLIRLPRLANTYREDVSFKVRPICLPITQGMTIPNTVTRVAGWGRSTNNYKNDLGISDALTAYLQYVIIPVKTVDQCLKTIKSSKYGNNTGLISVFEKLSVESQLCGGGEDGKDSCGGDSGGPLMGSGEDVQNEPHYLIGIVSFGTGVCGIGVPGVYTNVEYYMDWIRENLKP